CCAPSRPHRGRDEIAQGMTSAISRRALQAMTLACALAASSGLAVPTAAALEHSAPAKSPRTADASTAAGRSAIVASRAPSSPPLTTAGGAAGGAPEDGASPQGETDPLVSNGLGR